MMSLAKIRIVLVRPFHAGNIGSVARSLKTMGLSDLCLVKPRDFPSAQAQQMAAGAQDILQNVTVVEDLTEAIHDCTVTIACTARPRGYDLPELYPQQAAELLINHAAHSPVALIFGPERMGLHNKDIQLAKYRLTIPANPQYSSLNLAAATQIVTYEIHNAAQRVAEHTIDQRSQSPLDNPLPTSNEIEYLHRHLEKVLKDIGFLRPHQGETLLRLRHLINRAQINQGELNILRGILTAIEKNRSKPN